MMIYKYLWLPGGQSPVVKGRPCYSENLESLGSQSNSDEARRTRLTIVIIDSKVSMGE